MARLINILAASVGGGLVLGAGIRVAEAVLAREAEASKGAGWTDRLSDFEQRLGQAETGRQSRRETGDPVHSTGLKLLESRIDLQQREVDSLCSQLAAATSGIGDLSAEHERLRSEVRTWVDTRIDTRITEAEAKLRASIENSQRNTLDAIVDAVQNRVILRISKLENDVAGQSAAMAELRECSLQTERSMQKLLEGIDRLVGAQTPHAEPAGEVTSAARAVEPAAEEKKPEQRRWGLFS